ncbi:FtsK/SpoIIIE domain-containing protein [Arthrobacter koreensis]|uniref:FtsK/SpoIIIE domain-containing protein n=1 Tax=Arthrobacter koreensis TaxID=199136 RepID=UPI003D8CBE76
MSSTSKPQQTSILEWIISSSLSLLMKLIGFAWVTILWLTAIGGIALYYPDPLAIVTLMAVLVVLGVWFFRTRSPLAGAMLPGVSETLRFQKRMASRNGQDLAERMSLLNRHQLDSGLGKAQRLRHPRAKTSKPIVVDGWNLIAPGGDRNRLRRQIEEMMDVVGGVAVEVTGSKGVYSVVIHRVNPPNPLDEVRDSASPEDSLHPFRVGRFQDGTDAYVDLRDASHIAIQGMSRSGKSVFCYGLLSQLSRLSEVRVMGVDPNSLLLAPWKHRARAGDIALGSDPAAALDVIDRAVSVMSERFSDLLRMRVEKLEDFTPESPLVVVVLEEFPALIRAADIHDSCVKPAERLTPRIRGQVSRLVSEGAKVGVRVIIVAQRADASIIEGSTRAQLGTRITFRVDNPDAIKMLHPVVDPEMPAIVRSFQSGRCLFWNHGSEDLMQADYTDYTTTYLNRVEGGHNDA